MVNCKILPIDEKYNSEMLSILKASPINANGLSLYFDKSPDIFEIPRRKYTSGEHVGFFIDEKLKGFGSLGYYDALVKGKVFLHFIIFISYPKLAANKFRKLL
jgi:hypothetical protein